MNRSRQGFRVGRRLRRKGAASAGMFVVAITTILSLATILSVGSAYGAANQSQRKVAAEASKMRANSSHNEPGAPSTRARTSPQTPSMSSALQFAEKVIGLLEMAASFPLFDKIGPSVFADFADMDGQVGLRCAEVRVNHCSRGVGGKKCFSPRADACGGTFTTGRKHVDPDNPSSNQSDLKNTLASMGFPFG